MEMNGNGTPDTRAGHLLPCGRTVEQVWQDMEDGRPAEGHPPDCPHCATARASLEQLAEATRLLVDEPVQPPVGLLDRVMAAVRADLAQGDSLALPALDPTPMGATVEVSVAALAAVLRFAVDSVPGVRAHRCRIEADPDEPTAVRVWMSVSLRYGSGTLAALDPARDRVAAALSNRIGLSLALLDFEVVDVWTDPPPAGDAATGEDGP